MPKISEHELKMASLTTQMRQNQEELASFMKDMESWEKDIKSKDSKLKQQKPVEEQKLPPVRNSLDKKKKKKVKKKSDAVSSKPKRISSYDYRSWDKFDVDKACQAVGDVGQKSGSSSEYETDEEWEVERRKQAAIMEKDKGNDYFKRGDMANAIECYTRGAEMDPTNPLLPANRAMALLKQDKFAAAEVDCTEALALDPLYTKAYLRRAAARMGLKKFSEAKQDYERVLQLEPQNKKAKLDLEVIEKELAKENLVSHTEPNLSHEAGVVKAIFKAPHERSKKPLRRIHIEDVGGEEAAERKAAIARTQASQGEKKKQVVEKDSEMFQRFTATSPADIGKVVSSHQNGEIERGDIKTVLDDTQNSEKIAELKETDTQMSKSVSTDIKASENKGQNRYNTVKSNPDKSEARKRDITPTTSPRELPAPTTSFQFQADYKILKNNQEAFYRYFKKIVPDQYQKLFGSSLDAEVLLTILNIFKAFYIQSGEDFFPHLQCLTKVQRFSMTVMFFSSREKQVVKELFDSLRSSGNHTTADIDELAKKYDQR